MTYHTEADSARSKAVFLKNKNKFFFSLFICKMKNVLHRALSAFVISVFYRYMIWQFSKLIDRIRAIPTHVHWLQTLRQTSQSDSTVKVCSGRNSQIKKQLCHFKIVGDFQLRSTVKSIIFCVRSLKGGVLARMLPLVAIHVIQHVKHHRRLWQLLCHWFCTIFHHFRWNLKDVV